MDVDQFGFVTLCSGLSIGNTRQMPLKEIIKRYNYQDYPIIAALYDGGVKGLMKPASKYGFSPKEAYAHGCHLCYEARKFLRNYFPQAYTLSS